MVPLLFFLIVINLIIYFIYVGGKRIYSNERKVNMTLDELQENLHMQIGDGNGNMCFYCAFPQCQYLLKGEMYYGQEVGPGGQFGDIIYECPKFIMQDNSIRHRTSSMIKCRYGDILKVMADEIRDLDSSCKLNNVYRMYNN